MTDCRIRKEAFYRGHVQGVGFRYSTASISSSFAVTGFVKNLADGRVQIVAEGDQDEVVRFLDAVEDRLGRYIREVVGHEEAYRGDFSRFEIAF